MPAALDLTSGDVTVHAVVAAYNGRFPETAELVKVAQLDLRATDQSCPEEVPYGGLIAIRWLLAHPWVPLSVIGNINGLGFGASVDRKLGFLPRRFFRACSWDMIVVTVNGA